jgi:hypothetical protein
VLDFRSALLVAAALKLFALGFFTFLFLRELGLAFAPALFGAAAFEFCGLNVLLLAYPHSGVHAALPAALFCVERALRRFEAGAGARAIAAPVAGLALVLALGLYAGHPEPFVFVAALSGAWALFRLAGAWRAAAPGARRPVLALAGGLAAAGVLALGLALPQVLPFLEYLGQSVTFDNRVPIVQPSLFVLWPLLLFPNAMGSSLAGWGIAAGAPPPNYEQVNCSYPGGTVLLLALLGLPLVLRDARARFFGVVALGWVLLTGDLAGLGRLYDSVPMLGNLAPLSRSQSLWLFPLCVLAALGLGRMLAAPRAGGIARGAAVLALGVAVLLACRWGAARLLDSCSDLVDPRARDAVLARIRSQELWLSISFGAGAVALAVVAAAPRRALACAAVAVAGAAAFFQEAWILRNYNPTTSQRFVYPRTTAIETLQHAVGDGRLVILSENGLPPQTNMVPRIATLQVYDALGLDRFERLYALGFDAQGPWRDAQRASELALRLFGVEFVATPGAWICVGTELGSRLFARDARYQPTEVLPGLSLTQEFVCEADGLRAIAVLAGTRPAQTTAVSDLHVRVLDDAGARIAEKRFTAAELRNETFAAADCAISWTPFEPSSGWVASWAVLSFEPPASARGRRFRIVLDATAGAENDATTVWTSAGLGQRAGVLSFDGKPAAGRCLLYDYACGPGPFARAGRAANLGLFRYTASLGPYYTVSQAALVDGPMRALAAMAPPDFDPYRTVVLERAPRPLDPRAGVDAPEAEDVEAARRALESAHLADPEPAARAVVRERSPQRVVLAVERKTPGWLVAAQSWYPGWKATVDGAPAELVCANLAFSAVAVPAGAHEIVLSYEPASLRIGLWLAAASAAIGAGLYVGIARGGSRA